MKKPKQETLEEAAEKRIPTSTSIWDLTETRRSDFKAGAKWQAQRMYSEEEVKDIVEQTIEKFYKHTYADKTIAEMKELWFEQFKKKQL